jgi:hypothetical protein
MRTVFALAAALFLSFPAFADTYIWKDPSGTQVVGSTPPSDGTPYIRVPEGEMRRPERAVPVEPEISAPDPVPAPAVERQSVTVPVPVIIIREYESPPVTVIESQTWNTISTVDSLRKKKRHPAPATSRAKNPQGGGDPSYRAGQGDPPYIPGQGDPPYIPGRR